jgi:hypothetical protein
MKKTLLILGGIGLVCTLLIARLFFAQHNRVEEEREWFVKNVRYEFSARVDSVELVNEHVGRLSCRILSGNAQTSREDSLKRFFKEHDMLYFIFQHSGDSILFIVRDAQLVNKNDSIRVSSGNNSIQVFREGQQIAIDKLSNILTGFGKPFFLKGKHRQH